MWIARWERRREICPDCGNPIAKCSDPDRRWYPYRRICYATMEREAAQAAYDALHKKMQWHDGTFTSWAEERSNVHPVPATAGVTVGVADHDLTPWDHFNTLVEASPRRPEQLPGNEHEADQA